MGTRRVSPTRPVCLEEREVKHPFQKEQHVLWPQSARVWYVPENEERTIDEVGEDWRSGHGQTELRILSFNLQPKLLKSF